MPAVLYVFVDKLTLDIFRQEVEDGPFVNDVYGEASESYLAKAMCLDDFKYVRLNAYKLLQPTFNLDVDSVFVSGRADPHLYYYWSLYGGNFPIYATEEEIAQEDWFEQTEFLSDYTG